MTNTSNTETTLLQQHLPCVYRYVIHALHVPCTALIVHSNTLVYIYSYHHVRYTLWGLHAHTLLTQTQLHLSFMHVTHNAVQHK